MQQSNIIGFRYSLSIIFTLGSILVFGQKLTPYAIPFFADDKVLTLADIGGLSAPQFNVIDLDRDGIKDILLFDRNGNVLSALRNKGVKGVIDYELRPDLIVNFPKMQFWCAISDYDGDGVEDIFTFPTDSNVAGIQVWKGSVKNGLLEFVKVKNANYDTDVLTVKTSSGIIPIYMSFIDYPAIIDVDGDGDIDILTFESGGSYLEMYKNTAVEQGLPKTTLNFELSDRCFGKFYEDQFSEKITTSTTGADCAQGLKSGSTGSGKARHTGSTLFAFDPDCDGDKDLIIGDVINEYITYLTNGGTKSNPWITNVDLRFPKNSEPFKAFVFPIAFSLDADNDGEEELIITVNETSNAQTKGLVWMYKNRGEKCNPNYQLISKTFIEDLTIDVGNSAHPHFYDYNADGLLDIIVGTNGEIISGQNRKNKLSLFINTGTKTKPAYTLATNTLLDIDKNQSIFPRLSPTSGDMDGDGDIDIVLGQSQGGLIYAQNIAGKGKAAVFAPLDFDWMGMFVGQNASPTLIDFDRDGKLDLVVGKFNNSMNFFRNIGTTSIPKFDQFSPNDVNLGRIFSVNDFGTQNGSPEFFQAGGKRYLLMGYNNGSIASYEANSTISGDPFSILSLNLLSKTLGRQTNPAVADIDGDGFYEVAIGNDRGGFNFFKTDININGTITNLINDLNTSISIYPNPIENELMINGLKEISSIMLYNSVGQLIGIYSAHIQLNIDMSRFENGTYMIRITNSQQTLTKKLIKRS